MKKRLMLPAVIAALLMAISFTSCSEEDDSAFESAVAAAKERNKETPTTPSTPTPPPPPANVTVTFDVNGGTALATSEYTFVTGRSFQSGSGLTYLPITTKEGYEFQNWNTKPDGTGSSLTSLYQTINSTVTYYAYWKPLITKVETTVTNYVNLEIGEQKVFTFKYEPADASTNWSYSVASGFNGISCTIKDNHDGFVEYTLSGTYAKTGIFTITETKSNKAYAIEATVNKPSGNIPVLSLDTASSTDPAKYTGLDKTLDSTTPMLLYKIDLLADTSYTFQFVNRNNQDTIGATDLGYCNLILYNSELTDWIYDRTSITGGYQVRPYSSQTCYVAIQKSYGNSNTAKGGVHVYKTPSVTAINIPETTVNLTLGDSSSKYVEFTTTPADAYMNLSITSSDNTVARPSWNYSTDKHFWIYYYKAGTATFTIKDTLTNVSTTCTINVTGTSVTSLALSQTTLAISQGETKTLTVTPTPENANVSYSSYSYDERIARISRSGTTVTVTGGVVPGSTTYTVYDYYTRKSATCTITNTTGITAATVTDELPVVGSAASTSLADYTIASLNNAQPVKYYKVEVPAANSGKRYNFQTARNGYNPIIGETFVAGECYFYLYDQDFNLLTYEYSGTIQRNLTAGTYYFAIVYHWPYTTSTYSAKGGVHLYVTN